MKRLPNLDVLRFLLASLVIFFHVPQLCRNQGLPYFSNAPIFHRGTEAVFMFFVLSGFLIIKIIYKNKQEEQFSIKNFYMKRILRIFPLYYLVLIFGFLFYWVVLPKLGIPFENNYNLSEAILLGVFFMPNIMAKMFMPGGILEILWSIGIEEQFYIIIAPLLYCVNKARVLDFLLVLTGLYFLVFHLEVLEFLRKFSMVFFYLFFGGIISILEEKNKLNFLKKNKSIPIIIVLLTLLYFTTPLFEFQSDFIFNLFTMLLFGLFIHSIAHNNLGIILKNKTLNYLGQISYGIYMFHVVALNTVVFLFLKIEKMSLFKDTTTIILIFILTFSLTIFMAHLSFKYFESYFLNLKNKYRQ